MSASSMKSIKTRIKSIESTMQITKAMELVASSKMRRVMDAAERTKPYFNILRETLEDISADNRDFSSVFTRERIGCACHIVIAGDRGLAGGYNANLFKTVDVNDGDIIFPLGKKAAERYVDCEIYTLNYERTADITISDCRNIGEELAAAYKRDAFAELYLSYTSFKNALMQEPETVKLLPIRHGIFEKGNAHEDRNAVAESRRRTILYEPDAETVFDEIIPGYISGMLYGAVCESVASEIAARRNAMEAANKNASDMLDRLRLEYNQARQGAITQEITEIIAGAENM